MNDEVYPEHFYAQGKAITLNKFPIKLCVLTCTIQ